MIRLLIFFLLMPLFACSQTPENSGHPNPERVDRPAVTSGGYRLMLRTLLSDSVPSVGVAALAGHTDGVALLDARSPEEYAVSHLRGARWVGFDTFDSSRVAGLSPTQPVVVYCSVGYRSERITERMRGLGFTDVRNLYGGLFEWVNQGHLVYRQDAPTTRVHAFNRAWGVWLQRGEKVYK